MHTLETKNKAEQVSYCSDVTPCRFEQAYWVILFRSSDQ